MGYRGALPAHDLHREHPDPPWPRLTGVILATNEFDEQCEDDFGLRLELGGELLEQEEDNTGATEGKRESGALGERFEEQGENVVLK
jgi:hypothetical protein